MKRAIQSALVIGLAAQALVIGQGSEVARVLAAMRAALGGEAALSAVKTVSIEGRATRSRPDGSSSETDLDVAMELPGKFVKREVIANLGGTAISRRNGFNGAELIDEIDAPPALGGAMIVRRPGDPMPGGQATPEQLEAQKRGLLLSARRDFTRLALGMFGAGSTAYPVEFTYAGLAESPDGKADILDVKAADGFAARLFVDAATHLPLMLTWMDKEPLVMRRGPGGAGNVQMMTGGSGHTPSPEEVDRIRKEAEQRMREAEANRRTVEYRIFYGEYKTIDGVRLPSKIQRMIDGVATEELALEKIKINAKLNPDTFRNQ
jgi:hypothetical protein